MVKKTLKNTNPRITATKITSIYLILSLIWILFSDMVLGILYKSSGTLTWMQSIKGTFFVIVTAFIIYVLIYRDIKSLKVSEDALIRSEKNYRHLIENAQEGIWNVDRRGKTLFINGRMAEMLGYTVDEIMGNSIFSFLDDKEVETAKKHMDLIEQGITEQHDLEFLQKNGDKLYALVETSPLKDDMGNYKGVTGFITDITRRKEAELRANYFNRLYAFLSQVNQSIVRIKDKNELFKAICQTAVEFGNFRMAWIGLIDEETGWVCAEEWAGYEEGFLQHVKINVTHKINSHGPIGNSIRNWKLSTTSNLQKNSKSLPWDEEAFKMGYRSYASLPLFYRAKLIGVLVLYASEVDFFSEDEKSLLEEIGDDISFALNSIASEKERKLVENNLKWSEEKYRTLYTSMNEGMAVHRVLYNEEGKAEDYVVLDVNPAYERILNICGGDIIGKKATEIYGTQEPPYIETYAVVADSGEPRYFETYFEPMNKYFRISVFSPKKGEFATVFEDITLSKRAEEKIKKLNEELEFRVRKRTAELESANKDMESFSYSVSHDLRAPLRVIRSFSRIISRRYVNDLDKEGIHYLNNIVDATQRMGSLIDNILLYSRTGRKSVQRKPNSLKNVLKEVLEDWDGNIKEKDAIITFPDDLPTINSDRTLLNQIFTNIIENALIYQETDKKPEINVSWQKMEENIRLYIKDNGIGIPEKYYDEVFKIFQRLHSEDKYSGTGIGLAIARRAAELMEGNLWIDSSREGEGTTFCLELPLDQDEDFKLHP
ncbi:Adaptive-response sensory-kinase SasA [anaerobic digester metagenome]